MGLCYMLQMTTALRPESGSNACTCIQRTLHVQRYIAALTHSHMWEYIACHAMGM